MMPLGRIRRASVFLDAGSPDFESTATAVRSFFEYHGIPLKLLAPTAGDLNWFGILRDPGDGGKWKEDLFVSLAGPENFAAEYAARCSTARFKVGRFDMPGGVFNLVVSNPVGQTPSQPAVFAAVKEYLTKIR